jgi:PKD repeat protein
LTEKLLVIVVGAFGLLGWLPVGVQAAPAADFTFSPQEPDINTEVTLDASPSQGRIVRYEWDFDGDGRFEVSLEEPSLVHLFDESGSHTVTLRVIDQGGEQATVSKRISVRQAIVMVRRKITAPLPPDRVPAGSSFQVTVTIRVNQMVSGLGLDEDPPEGWRVSSVEADGAIFKGSEAQWLWTQTLHPGETLEVVYNVTVPRGTTARLFQLEGKVTSFSPRFAIPIPGDKHVRVI